MVLAKSLFAFFVLLSTAAIAAPIEKRIAQTIADSTTAWVAACEKAGGAQQCQPISQTAFTSLLAAGKNCDQQDAADAMVDLAKQLNNDAEMIRLAQIFVQQPRNAPDSLQVPYCQTAPKNAELNGLFHCQFAGSKFPQFSGDQTGNVPLGLTAVNPAGSCPAKTDGPVADGVQLETLVTDPGAPSSGSGSSGNSTPPASSSAIPPASSSAAPPASGGAAPPASSPANNSGSGGSPASGSASGFQLQNAKDAQALNAQFASLTPDSSCNDGDQACVQGGFAQCVGGKFQITQCSGGLQCVALPLVNKPGTSITCDTQADADARIAAAGATGGANGSGASSGGTGTGATPSDAPAPNTPAANNAAAGGSSTGFQLQNGQEAQKLNAQFASLTAGSSCNTGDQACVEGGFAQCVDGKFQITQCAGGLQCFALPLVNSPGTSVTCDTQADAEARIASSGAGGGITGTN